MDPRYISQPFSRAALHGPAALIGLACDSVPGLTYDESVAAHESAMVGRWTSSTTIPCGRPSFRTSTRPAGPLPVR